MAHGSSGSSHPVHRSAGQPGIGDGMHAARTFGAGEVSRPPADPPEWSVPSPWTVAEPPIPAPVLPPPPPPGRGNPNRLTAALVVALVLSMVTAAWAAIDRLDINLSRPSLGAAPDTRPGTLPARPGGGFSGRPWRSAPSGSAPDIDVNAVAARVQPGVVDIYTQLSNGLSGAGTGMILTPDGEVLTNNHVISGSTSIAVELRSCGARYSAVELGSRTIEDLALLPAK